MTGIDGTIALAVWAVVLVVAGRLVWVWLYRPVTVFATEHALRYRDGALVGPLPTGRHRLRRTRDVVRLAPARPQLLTLPGQEILTSDGVPVKISLLATARVDDPVTAVHETESWFDSTYAALQVALRAAVTSQTVDDLLAGRDGIAASTLAHAAPSAAGLGVTLVEVRVKDLMLTGPVRDLFAKVVTARKDGEARLERVRAETASMRALANAARLVDDQPALLTLRAVAGADNVTVVLGGDGLAADGRPAAATTTRAAEDRDR